jgi:small conductance mechanosensitive channel
MIQDMQEQVAEPIQTAMRSKAIKTINKAFNEQDITIPFPIRTLDFRIKCEQKLSQMELNAKGVKKNKYKIV